MLWDENEVLSDDKITRVVLCSGKVYFDLAEARQSQGIKDTYVLRLEQISPFPDEALTDELGRFMNAKQIVWCQEEPQNMGGWTYVDRPIEAVLGNIGHQVKRPVYAGRPASASPATGLHRRHVTEQNALVKQALKGT